MKTIHLSALDLDIDVPDTVHVHPEEIFQDIPARRKELFKKYNLKTAVEDDNPLGETMIVEIENGELNIQTYYPDSPQIPIRAHEEMHIALVMFAITRNRKIPRELMGKLEKISGMKIDFLKETKHIKDRDDREETIAYLAELIYAGKTCEISDYYPDFKDNAIEEARRIYMKERVRKLK